MANMLRQSKLGVATVRSMQARRSMATSASATAATHIVGVSGSLRKASRNTGLLRAIANKLPPNVTFEIADISQLPLYNDDLWQGGDAKNDDSALPEAVRVFRKKIQGADAVVFSSPEYNFSISGPLKNAIDWTSKGPSLWNRKLVTAVGAAGGSLGARSAMALHTTICSVGAIYPPTGAGFVFVNAFSKQFDADGNVVDPALEASLVAHVGKVAEWAVKLNPVLRT